MCQQLCGIERKKARLYQLTKILYQILKTMENTFALTKSRLSQQTKVVLVEAVRKATTCNEVWFLVKATEKQLDLSKILQSIENQSFVPCKVCKPPRLSLGTFMNLHFVPDPMP